uniref:uncharacterized protein LOC118146080 n=1 Tax=Callithrix jacchus TaxID=9483 RepID=UPI0023DD1C34|nr:uncharacterized protein LOC118146080 [Callithrix jacchus]
MFSIPPRASRRSLTRGSAPLSAGNRGDDPGPPDLRRREVVGATRSGEPGFRPSLPGVGLRGACAPAPPSGESRGRARGALCCVGRGSSAWSYPDTPLGGASGLEASHVSTKTVGRGLARARSPAGDPSLPQPFPSGQTCNFRPQKVLSGQSRMDWGSQHPRSSQAFTPALPPPAIASHPDRASGDSAFHFKHIDYAALPSSGEI